jgi:hypothetical protein
MAHALRIERRSSNLAHGKASLSRLHEEFVNEQRFAARLSPVLALDVESQEVVHSE